MASYYLRFAIAAVAFGGLIAHFVGMALTSMADAVTALAHNAPLS
jgi:hypothetical protein